MEYANRENIAITKIQMSKVYTGEYKEVHTRTMELDASYGAVNQIAYTLDQKRNNKLTVEDLAYTPDIITYSDRPSALPVEVNGGWNNNRYAFMIEITMRESVTSSKRIYLSGYTDRDDVFSISGEINPNVELIFNDVLVTQSILNIQNGMESTRIITAAEILPTPDRESNRDTTLTPSDVYKAQQGKMYTSNDNTYDGARVSMMDFRLKNNGGKISRKQNASLDNHLVSVANKYLMERSKDEFRTENDIIADLTFSTREPDIKQAVALFRLLDERNIKNTNCVRFGDLLDICPMHFVSPQSDYIVLDKPYGAPDVSVSNLASQDRGFRALTTSDSISTAATNVETKLAFMLLQEVMALMSIYKVTTVGANMTNMAMDRSGRPLIAVPKFDSFVRAADLTTSLYESFREALYTVFNKITSRNMIAVEAHLFIGFNTEKIEISVDGGHKVVLSLPRFMSSHFSNVVGSLTDLNMLADNYNSLFKEISKVVETTNMSVVENKNYM